MDFATLDGVAGLAALINGLILWPIVRTLKRDHGERIARLEQSRSGRTPKEPRAASTRRRKPRRP